MLFKTKHKYWHEDDLHSYRIDGETVKDYFNKTQDLVFSSESAKIEERVLRKHIKVDNKARVLDLGCGDGRWGSILIPKCRQYIGVDFSSEFIIAARKNHASNKAMFYCHSAQDYFVEEKFDLILIVGVTTYMNDDEVEKMANNCSKMLSQRGKLFIRSVTLKEKGTRRMVYFRKSGFIRKLFGRPNYQIIRRSPEEEIKLFSMFKLEHQEDIPGTGYTLYILHL